MISRKAQIWVETVIYTLIGIALIGLVLAILTPKIKEFRDRSVIEQTIDSLNLIDSKIVEVLDAPGNKRKVNLKLDKGRIEINSSRDEIKYVLGESNVRYSEPNVQLNIGRIKIFTKEINEKYEIILYLNYTYNITYAGSDSNFKDFSPVSIPYEFFIENKGLVNNRLWIDINEGS